ncbi:hypothetical protein FOBRF1_012068 [Fusarium oxysporum]
MHFQSASDTVEEGFDFLISSISMTPEPLCFNQLETLDNFDSFGTDNWSASSVLTDICDYGSGAYSMVPKETEYLKENDQTERLASSADDSPSFASSTRQESSVNPAGPPMATPKVGAHLSRETQRILRQWFDAHSDNPYPDDGTKEALHRLTGLTKTQLTNWFANARRRYKTTTRSDHRPQSIDILKRPGTPLPQQQAFNPMQRWIDSPPKDEPVPISAIVGAVSASLSNPPAYENTRPPTLYPSSLSSAGTSGGDSSSPARFGSSDTHRNRVKRRKRAPSNIQRSKPSPFECTFCTEKFRKKYDWQRHEKSIHLGLERWLCRAEEPVSLHPETGKPCCVLCSREEPDKEHIQTHNPSACEERVFNRKDHLRQHLRLVHRADFVSWSMDFWKDTIFEVRSRCGFCDFMFDTWQDRVDHLAEHFKIGHTMAAWKGGWGFDEPILKMVENAIPPYLICTERNSPFPFQGSSTAANSPRSAYELISLELMQLVENHHQETGSMPSNQILQLEACRIIFASEAMSTIDLFHRGSPSWLRDVIMSNHDVARQALFGPIRSRSENRLPSLEIKGQRSLFDNCPFEFQLRKFVDCQLDSGRADVWDAELQQEACKIMNRIKGSTTKPSYNSVSTWLITTILGSTNWLSGFRQRTNLVPDGLQPRVDPKHQQGIDGLMRNVHLMEPDTSFLQPNLHSGRLPTSDLSHQNIVATSDRFDDRIDVGTDYGANQLFWVETSPYMLNDSNFHERLGKELGRWVASTISPRNPQSHMPTDEELRHQARWIAYGE